MGKSDVFFSTIIKPNAKETKILGWHDGYVKISIQSAPINGKANKTLIELLSIQFNVAKKQVEILHGESSRIKRVCIHNTKKELADVIKAPPNPESLAPTAIKQINQNPKK